jgi:hypothetical protein
MITAESQWIANHNLLITRLQGPVDREDVHRWKASLEQLLNRIDNYGWFKIIIDLHGYEPGTIATHKEMRSIIPLTLAAYGLRTALLDLFDAVDLSLQKTRGISCVAAAHVHHDAEKMEEYDRRIGRTHERFFTDYYQAEAWILTIQGSKA